MVWKLAFIFTLVLRYLTNPADNGVPVKVAKRAADTMAPLPQLRYLIGESFTRTLIVYIPFVSGFLNFAD